MKNVVRLLFFSMVLILSGCLEKSSESSNGSSGSENPSASTPATALTAKTQSTDSRRFSNLNGGQIDGTENLIYVSTSDGSYTWTDCISVYFPQFKRFSIFRTNFLLGNKSIAFAMAFPGNDGTPPELYYWEGSYVFTQGVVGHPSFVTNSPTFAGRAQFDEVRVPDGQQTPDPSHRRIYYTHSWFNTDGSPFTSMILQNYLPPASWTFRQPNFTQSDVTPQLVHGASCIKFSEIINFVN